MDMINTGFVFNDLYPLILTKPSEYLTNLNFQATIYDLAPSLRNPDYMVFTLPYRMLRATLTFIGAPFVWPVLASSPVPPYERSALF